MLELVDKHDSGSCEHNARVGSTPTIRIVWVEVARPMMSSYFFC